MATVCSSHHSGIDSIGGDQSLHALARRGCAIDARSCGSSTQSSWVITSQVGAVESVDDNASCNDSILMRFRSLSITAGDFGDLDSLPSISISKADATSVALQRELAWQEEAHWMSFHNVLLAVANRHMHRKISRGEDKSVGDSSDSALSTLLEADNDGDLDIEKVE